MDSLFRLSAAFGLLCLSLASTIALAQDDVEIPQGYEDAAVADEAAPPAEADDMEDENPSLIEVLAGALADDVDPNIANLQRQFLPQFQQLWKAELGFLQRSCSLKKEQRAEIDKARDQIVKAAARKYALAQNKRMRGGRDPFGGRQSTTPDPRTMVQQQMTKVAKGQLSPEQVNQYQEECDKRSAHRKRVAVLNLVAKLDERLVLTAEQRDKLIESLSSNYQGGWGQSLEMFRHNMQFLPSIPDRQIVPILNPTQTTVWHGARKQQSHIMMGGMGFAQAMVVIDDDFLVEEEVVIEVEEK